MRITRNGSADEEKPRKIADVRPVEWGAKRAQIQRAYTKSIHENEQKEIRAANLRRLSERFPDKTVHDNNDGVNKVEPAPIIVESEPVLAEPVLDTTTTPPQPLHISTSFTKTDCPVDGEAKDVAADQDSPTLGMPGSFVDDDLTPASAMSNATGITDFDNEQQTEPPKEQFATRPMSSQFIEWNDLSPEQASFGMDHSLNALDSEEGSISMMLDTSINEEPHHDSTPTNDVFNRDPSPPGAFKRDSEYDRPMFATTITTASPKETTPEQSRAASPLKTDDEALQSKDELLQESHAHESGNSHIHPPPEIIFHPETSTPEPIDPLRIHSSVDTVLVPPMSNIHDYLNTPASELDYESSDGYGPAGTSEPENYDNSYEHQLGIQTSAHRASHQSGWTDFSIETTDESSDQGEYSHPVAEGSEPLKKSAPPPEVLSPVVPLNPESYSPQPSPSFATTDSQLANPARHQLPPLSTGDGLGFGFSDRSPRFSGTVPLWPEHSPPPPPVPQLPSEASPAHPTRSPPPPTLYNRRPPSSIFQGSQNGTSRNTDSRRASEDIYSPRASSSTPRSSTQISLEDVTPSQSFESKEGSFKTEEEKQVAEKRKKRLFQRRMLIKELIDTESVYLKDMNVVEEIYKGTAEACPKLDGTDVKTIFRNTDEIVAFSTMFLDELKSAGSSVYSPRSNRSRQSRAASATISPTTEDRFSIAATLTNETDEQKDMKTFVGANFGKHLKKMQSIYTDFLKNGELASTRLTALQADDAVQVWLHECNTVAKDLTAAWSLDALLVKPVQRITRYQLLLAQIFEHTSEDHPDYRALQVTVLELAGLLKHIDDLKKRIQMVGNIVGRKRKESDVRTGIAKAFGRRAEKLSSSNANRPHDDEAYVKLHEKYGDDYLRLQVVLRDVEFYTRQVTTYVNDFLRYLSAMELVMRLSASPYPELESKWARFNMSMRDMGTVGLEDHV